MCHVSVLYVDCMYLCPLVWCVRVRACVYCVCVRETAEESSEDEERGDIREGEEKVVEDAEEN